MTLRMSSRDLGTHGWRLTRAGFEVQLLAEQLPACALRLASIQEPVMLALTGEALRLNSRYLAPASVVTTSQLKRTNL